MCTTLKTFELAFWMVPSLETKTAAAFHWKPLPHSAYILQLITVHVSLKCPSLFTIASSVTLSSLGVVLSSRLPHHLCVCVCVCVCVHTCKCMDLVHECVCDLVKAH